MMYEGSDTEQFALPITSEGVIRLVPRLRERYLTPDVEEAVVQASGYALRIWIWSDRSNIEIRLLFDGFRSERPYTRSVNSWGVNVNRWRTRGKDLDGEHAGWHNDASLEIAYGGSSNKPMIEAEVRTFEGAKPDV